MPNTGAHLDVTTVHGPLFPQAGILLYFGERAGVTSRNVCSFLFINFGEYILLCWKRRIALIGLQLDSHMGIVLMWWLGVPCRARSPD